MMDLGDNFELCLEDKNGCPFTREQESLHLKLNWIPSLNKTSSEVAADNFSVRDLVCKYQVSFFYDELRNFVTMFFRIFVPDEAGSGFKEILSLAEMERLMDRLNESSAYKSKVEFGSDRFSQEFHSVLETKVFKINNCTFQKEYSEFQLSKANLMLMISLHLNAIGIHFHPASLGAG